MSKIFSILLFVLMSIFTAQTSFSGELPPALGLKVSHEVTSAFKCADDAMDKISDESKKWYTVCEALESKDHYAAFMWKRGNYQKADFQFSLGDTFIANRMKKFPNQDSGNMKCEEDKNFVDQTSLKAVKVNCVFDIKNAKTLYLSFLYLYPKAAAKMKVNAVMVVSSESKNTTEEKFVALVSGFPDPSLKIESLPQVSSAN